VADGFYPRLRPKLSEPYSRTQISSGALFVVAAVALFALAVVLG
jgi:hypothetical protein